MAITDDLKKFLGGSSDERLEVIEKRTRERLLLILGSGIEEVPLELEYVVLDVSLKRFNRIGQEGMQSYSQEGLSMTFSESDFDEYADEIESWRKSKEAENDKKIGRFRLY
ncbi:phage head-tail connector protein [Lactococcus lactis]|uniref:Phage head-tail connector protein n=1 Tax=Lactococcus lactis TaxID=1358 RepID=A0A9X4NBF2_9LACT|nr:phage head-tail connector protein [Lactococcus lactis]MDG4980289.1 phage head-tail connector protein [Lactococcus lactis]